MDDMDALLRRSAHDAHLALMMLLLIFFRSFHGQGAGGAFEHLAVERFDGRVRFARLGEEDEAASFGFARRLIGENLNSDNVAVNLEKFSQGIFGQRFW